MLSACTWGQDLVGQGSASVGHTSRGVLRGSVRLPEQGAGYRVPTTWRERGNVFGTSQLVQAVKRVGVKLAQATPARVLGVADLSPLHGGWSQWHRSHQSGRDVDLLFLSVDAKGRPLAPPAREMIHYNGAGQAYAPRGTRYKEPRWRHRHFDDAGNWQVIKALLTDPNIRVQWIFASWAIKKRVLEQAREEDAPDWLMDYASLVIAQPSGVSAHDDHFHVRIYCPREDLASGCRDTGRVWTHERAGEGRYLDGERYNPLALRAMSAHLGWMPRI